MIWYLLCTLCSYRLSKGWIKPQTGLRGVNTSLICCPIPMYMSLGVFGNDVLIYKQFWAIDLAWPSQWMHRNTHSHPHACTSPDRWLGWTRTPEQREVFYKLELLAPTHSWWSLSPNTPEWLHFPSAPGAGRPLLSGHSYRRHPSQTRARLLLEHLAQGRLVGWP